MKTVVLQEVLDLLMDLGVILSTELQPPIKPTHGPCCTCQVCGRGYSDCVCSSNEIVLELNKLDWAWSVE